MPAADDLVLTGLGADYHRVLAAARDRAPIVWSETHRAWIVLTHDDVARGFRDRRLSSDRVAAFERLARTRPAAFQTVVDVLSGWMVFRDPPAHTRLREPVRSAFAPRRMAALEPTIERVVDDLLDGFASGDEVDLSRALAVPLPAIVIAELLGVPPADRERFQRWSNELAGIVFAASSRHANDDAAIAGATSFSRYFGELVERYRVEPADNLISAVVAGSAGLAPGEVVGACAMLLFAGHETTTTLLSNALWVLFDHPAELDRWRADRALDATVVDELVRYEGPATVMIRRATEDFIWHDAAISAGDAVYLCMAAANRDPAVFNEPDAFDVGRDPNPHLGFGWGIHHCLGAPLARLEARIALRALVDRFPHLAPVSAPRWGSAVIGRSAGPVRARLDATPDSARRHRNLVRQGYDAISFAYRDDDGTAPYATWLEELAGHLQPGASVLDVGCGAGLPADRWLVDAGFDVTGVDISEVQIRRARQLVPGATFVQADIATFGAEAESFDAIVSFYALIHLPLEDQRNLFPKLAGWLRPGGWLLAIVGHDRWTGIEDFHGAPMFWDHADGPTYVAWLQAAGIRPVWDRFIAEGSGGHTLILGQREIEV